MARALREQMARALREQMARALREQTERALRVQTERALRVQTERALREQASAFKNHRSIVLGIYLHILHVSTAAGHIGRQVEIPHYAFGCI